ncbi:MAG: glucose-1-phosphate cytidylyltransferase [Phycisphaerae bacterium]|nr:glucose-1-phosphate cytidylyltransferase [Phycisphaerae bacterium]
MKAVILAGGRGTRLMEESVLRPKPMIEIGTKPILWHIMKIYSHHGINDFVICLGYKGYYIKEYFANYALHCSDITFDMSDNTVEVHQNTAEPWRITLVDTGEATLTGGRLKRIAGYLHDDDCFCMTYGDGVADVDITASIAHHREKGLLATLTGVVPPGRFGSIETEGHRVTSFTEKPAGDGGWINGGFFVLSPKVLSYIDGDQTSWEADALHRLALDRQLTAYFHPGFWQPMDTLRDKHCLNTLWQENTAPWKVW